MHKTNRLHQDKIIKKLAVLVILFTVMPVLLIKGPVILFGDNVYASIIFEYFEDREIDHVTDNYYIMKDLETGQTIVRTARVMSIDDEYINQNNYLYRVVEVEENVAWAEFIEEVQLSAPPDFQVLAGTTGEYSDYQWAQQAQEAQGNPVVGIFHSHGAESYVPSDGDEFVIEGGGILEVGRSFVQALEEKGMEVHYSEETHVPHDAGAYQRSRRTAEELIKDGSRVLFDVHRDAVPAEEYIAQVNGEETVQIQFVVGRQNQNAQTIQEFAESLKNVVDERNPGLIKGIFMARGNYNQDLLPLSMLLEVGSHENTREGAERSIELFADSAFFYLTGDEAAQAQEGLGLTAIRGLLWVIFIVLLALGVYMLISTGSREELISKIKHFFSREFLDITRRKGNRGDE